jgi:cytochrome c-type biogenesis protein CcmH
MTTFWVVAGLLILGALIFILAPMVRRGKTQGASPAHGGVNLVIYRDQVRELDADLAAGTLSQAQHQSAKTELERRVLEESGGSGAVPHEAASGGERWVVVAVVIAVPLLTISLYLLLGKPHSVDDAQIKSEAAAPQVTQAQIESMVANLAKKLEAKPDDVEGWAMLGRSYATLRRFEDSRNAYAKAAALAPDNSELLTEYADVLAMTNGRSVAGEPEKVILHALKINPRNIKALALAGTAAFERKDYASAIIWWRQILPLVPADSPVARTALANISQAEGLSGRSLAKGVKE